MKAIGTFVLVASALRFLAEIISNQYLTIIHTAAGLWIFAALTWAGFTIPKMLDGYNAEQK
jgi:hypothetical protein